MQMTVYVMSVCVRVCVFSEYFIWESLFLLFMLLHMDKVGMFSLNLANVFVCVLPCI